MIGISAIIATYKRKHELISLFDSLLMNESKFIEVIIVDQNEYNLIDDIVDNYNQKIEIRHLKIEIANQSLARNYGVKFAKYPIICFPDDDCWFDNNSFDRVQEFFSTNYLTDLLIINWRQSSKSYKNSMPITKERIFFYKAPTSYSTYVLFFNKDSFRNIGGFREDIGLGKYIGSGEDTELIFRAAKEGLNIFFNSEIYVNHKNTHYLDRDINSLRSRQRGTGFIYYLYNLNYLVVLRGFLSPIIKVIISFNQKKIKHSWYIFLGRFEGFIYGIKNN